MQKRKYIAAISDTDILIHLTKAGHLSLLEQLFETVYIPEYIFMKELKKKGGPLFYDIEKIVKDSSNIFVIVADSDMDLIQKKVKRLTLNNIGDLVGRGEAECAALSKAKDIPIIISDNSTEFRFLSEFIMLTYFDLLALCIHHGIMDAGEAETIYNDINNTGKKGRPKAVYQLEEMDPSEKKLAEDLQIIDLHIKNQLSQRVLVYTSDISL